MKVLIVYGTTDGMTARIAERMAQTLCRGAHAVEVVSAAVPPAGLDPGAFDAILVGASLHAGGYQRAARRFVKQHLAALHKAKSAFFSVCLAIASKDPNEREAAWSVARALPARLGWMADDIAVFAGALMFSRYGFWRRFAMTRIARKELGDVDPTRDHVFTDWEAVDRFALDFVGRAAWSASASAGEAPVGLGQ
jgi:menaquinone-dependent protoporphyrinogen oxidase